MILSVRAKIVLITVIILLLTIGMNSISNSLFFSAEYSAALQSNVFVVGENLRSQLNRILKLGIGLENIVGFEKQCQETAKSYEYISYVMVVNLDRKILFHNEPSEHGKILTNPQILDFLKSESNNIQIILENGKEYYDVMIPVFGTHDEHIGAVRVGFPVEYVAGKAGGLIAQSFLVVLVSFGIAAFLLIFSISLWVTRPLTKLTDVIEDIGKGGDLNKRVKIHSKDEIGQLASAFNQMTIDLKKSQDQIKKHAEKLEQKVQERTKDLDEKVTELTSTKTAVLNMMEDMDKTNRELIETQEELKKSLGELKEMDVKKDQFISIAAHELKTPLTSIHGFSQLLQNRKVSNDFTKRNKYLKIMDHETKRLAKLVTDILDLSRIDLGTVKLNLDEVDVNELLKGLESEMNVQIKEKGLKSEYDIEKDIPRIVTDKEKLTEILINLIINAVKYTSEGIITVNIFRENKKMHFVVKDTGIGIAKEKHEKIFERFYQIDSSYMRKTPGVGLGLALCKEFVELLGGKIWVKSELGRGSEFHFTLPLKGVPKKYVREEEMKAEESLEKAEETRKRVKRLGIGK